MPAGTYDILIEQGATFEFTGTVQDADGNAIDLTGATLAAQIRKQASDPVLLATLTCALLVAASGTFKVSMTAADTAAIDVGQSGGAVRTLTLASWDLLITYAGGTKERLLQGVAKISPRVTA